MYRLLKYNYYARKRLQIENKEKAPIERRWTVCTLSECIPAKAVKKKKQPSFSAKIMGCLITASFSQIRK